LEKKWNCKEGEKEQTKIGANNSAMKNTKTITIWEMPRCPNTNGK